MKENIKIVEGIVIFGPGDFVPAQRLAATLLGYQLRYWQS
jgi:hypothetical protein